MSEKERYDGDWPLRGREFYLSRREIDKSAFGIDFLMRMVYNDTDQMWHLPRVGVPDA